MIYSAFAMLVGAGFKPALSHETALANESLVSATMFHVRVVAAGRVSNPPCISAIHYTAIVP